MTLHAIASPFVDTRAADLRLGLDLAPLEALATCTASDAELRVLGASHQVVGTLAVGGVNALVGVALCLWVFRDSFTPWGRRLVAGALAVTLVGLAGLAWFSGKFELSAQQRIYRDPIVASERSPYQDIVVTSGLDGRDVRLFLNGDLQFSTLDEYRYHEALVAPAMDGARRKVLILGGGDGLAARRVLAYPGVEQVTLVDLDPAVVDLARTRPEFVAANGDAMDDPRLTYRAADAFTWLRTQNETFDAIVVDFPDADDVATAKLYSSEIYGLMKRALAPGGRMVVQSGSPFFARQAYWTTEATLRGAGFVTTPYHVDVPSFGDWGFHLATRGGTPPALALAKDARHSASSRRTSCGLRPSSRPTVAGCP